MTHWLSGIAWSFLLYVAIAVVASPTPVPTVGSNQTSLPSLKATKDEREGIVLGHDLDSNWEEFLVPAPTVVCLLGSLTVISGKVDFALNPPQKGFQYIRHPESFRATLVQVANDGWDAFRIAQRNMDTVQLAMRSIPGELQTVEKHIAQAPVAVLQGLLDIRLGNIKESGDQCARLASQTEQKFVDVMLLMSEITESTTSTEGTYNADLAAAQIELNSSRILQKMSQDTADRLAKRETELHKEVGEFRAAYEKALKDIPSGWTLMGQQFLQGITKAVNGFVNTMINPTSIFKGSGGGGGGGSSKGKQTGVDTASLSLANPINSMLTSIKSAIQAGKLKEEFKPFLTLLNALKGPLASKNSKESASVLDLVASAEALINKIIAPGTSGNGSSSPDILKGIDALSEQIKPLLAQNAALGSDVNQGREEPKPSGEFDPVREGSENAKFQAQLRVQMLQDKERQYDKVMADLNAEHEKMANLMARMATLDMQTINFKEILKLIIEGMKHISTIREQWSYLVQFFSSITVRAQDTMKQIDTFTKEARLAIEQQDEGTRRYMLTESIRPTAIEIQKSAYFLYTLSKTYVDVSSRYIITQLAGMARLTVLPPAEQTAELKKLNQESTAAADQIRSMAKAKKDEYKRLLTERIASEKQLIQRQGGASEADVVAVRKGIDAAKAAEVDDDAFG